MTDCDIPSPDKADWKAIGERIRSYRITMGMSIDSLSSKMDVEPLIIKTLEHGDPRRNFNYLWQFIQIENLSVNWLFNGVGSYKQKDPEQVLPEAIEIERGCGIRKNIDSNERDGGTYSEEKFEFVMAINSYKMKNNKPFPSLTEIFSLIKQLGYRKTANPKINPTKRVRKNGNEHKKFRKNRNRSLLQTNRRPRAKTRNVSGSLPVEQGTFSHVSGRELNNSC